MIYDNNRTSMRLPFFETWRKMQAHEPLEPLENELADVIAKHPEYHAILSNPQENLERNHWPEFPEMNPFFHMALHQAIHEQVSTNRPAGILDVYKQLTQCYGLHKAEHVMIETLRNFLQQMQLGTTLTEAEYLAEIQKCIE